MKLKYFNIFNGMIIFLCSCEPKINLNNRTQRDMKYIAASAAALSMSGYQLNDSSLLSDIIKFNASNLYFPLKDRVVGDEIVDPFNRAYRVALRNGLLTIWSIGQNGIDDNGRGDDQIYRERIADGNSK